MDEAPQTGRLCSHGWIGCVTAVSANCRGQTAHDRNRQTRGRGSKAGQRPYKPGLAGGSRHFGGGRNGCRRCRSNWQAETSVLAGGERSNPWSVSKKNTPCCRGVPEACISPLPAQVFSCFFPMACAIMPKVSRTFADFRVRAVSAPRRDEAKGGKKNEEVYSTCP